MNFDAFPQSNSTAAVSVVDRSLKQENEVSTMTTSAVSTNLSPSSATAGVAASEALATSSVTSGAREIRSSAEYSPVERFAAKVALALLRWSNRRADRAQPTHQRMALILENERVRSRHDPFARTR
jgi:hypothetical protein